MTASRDRSTVETSSALAPVIPVVVIDDLDDAVPLAERARRAAGCRRSR